MTTILSILTSKPITYLAPAAMGRPQLSLTTLVLIAAALPIWVFLAVMVPSGTGFGNNPLRFLAAPFSLVGITLAIHRLFRSSPNAWGLSVLSAAVITLGSLSMIAWFDS